MVVMFPAGIRGVDGPQIYPGLYAVVGRNFWKFLKNFQKFFKFQGQQPTQVLLRIHCLSLLLYAKLLDN